MLHINEIYLEKKEKTLLHACLSALNCVTKTIRKIDVENFESHSAALDYHDHDYDEDLDEDEDEHDNNEDRNDSKRFLNKD